MLLLVFLLSWASSQDVTTIRLVTTTYSDSACTIVADTPAVLSPVFTIGCEDGSFADTTASARTVCAEPGVIENTVYATDDCTGSYSPEDYIKYEYGVCIDAGRGEYETVTWDNYCQPPTSTTTDEPTGIPTTDEPTGIPSIGPTTAEPTDIPSVTPTSAPTAPEEVCDCSGSGSWQVGAFGECSNSCGGGYQVRDVTCSTGMYSDCTDEMPWPYQECNTDECIGPCAELMNDNQGLMDFLAGLNYPVLDCAQVINYCDVEQVRNFCAESCCLEDNKVKLNF